MGKYPGMLIAWATVVIASVLFGFLEPASMTLTWVAAILLAIVTFARLPAGLSALARAWWYRAVLGVLLASTVLGTVAAASTVGVDQSTGSEHLLFGCSAGVNVLLAILTWRALVRPGPRRAAFAGLIAIAGPMIALIVDAIVGVRFNLGSDMGDQLMWGELMLWAFVVTSGTGVFACIAALTSFGERSTLPEARQVEPARQLD